MTAVASAASIELPQTQNTAPVLEFRCLWTSDIRRKQKRWQDGRLKFHTFNRRVMVYDERSNFVGDTHWREDSDFGEGEELELERSGILVEVGECIGKKEQDLTGLIGKRVKDREERVAAKTASVTSSRPQVVRLHGNHTPVRAPHLRPKSLNALLGTPISHYGKAVVSTTSPFEERQLLNNVAQGENDRPAKRRKLNEPAPGKSGYAQNLMGATLRFLSRPPSTATIRYEPLRVASSSQTLQKVSIDLTEGDEEPQERSARTIVRDANARGDDHIENRMPKRISEKSPRRGYASNITGAALSLAEPQKGPSSRPINNSAVADKIASRSRQVDMDSSSSNEERIISTKKSQKTVEKSEHGPKDRSRSVKVSVSHLSSSPPRPDHRASKSSAVSDQAIATKVTGLQRIAEQPHSALRIKSRPPRKMMMLMNRPSSRSSASNEVENLNQINPERPRRLNSGSFSDIETLATRVHPTGAVRQKTVPIGAGAASNQNGSNEEEFPSSLFDSGIDHQTIDALLSCKNTVAQKAKRRVKEIPPAREKTPPALHNEVIGLAIAEKSNITVQSTTRKRKSSPATRESTSLNISTRNFSEESQETIPANPEQSVRNAQPKTKQTSPAIVREVQVRLSTEVRLTRQKSKQNNTSSVEKLNATINPRSERPGTEEPSTTEIQRPVADSIQNANALPQHVSDAISCAREHFRAQLFSRTDRGAQLDRTAISELREGHENQSCVINDQPKLELASSGPAIKPSPKPPPHLFHLSSTETKDTDVVGFVSANDINGPGEVNQIPVPLLTTSNLPNAPFKLSNPVTRGQLIQVTMHTTAHENAVPPPCLPQPRRIAAIGGASRDARVLIEKAASSGGPWSRESFDLFGAWRPPGKDTNGKDTNPG